MLERTIESDPRPARPRTRTPDRPRETRPLKYERQRNGRLRRPARERSERALVDVGIYRCVAFRDVAEAHFDGRSRTARRAVNAWIREGLVRESGARAAKGEPLQLLTLTRRGVIAVRDLAAEQGLDPEQRIGAARLRRSQVGHDTAVYRACARERRRLLEGGAAIRRVRLEGDLRGAVQSRSQSARVRAGGRAADAERHTAARELGLPIDPRGRVLLPDAQIEHTDRDGRSGRVNIEVVSDHYGASDIRSKGEAGFVLYAVAGASTKALRALAQGSTRGAAGRDPAVFQL